LNSRHEGIAVREAELRQLEKIKADQGVIEAGR
jgi:hypothetical protein